MGRALRVKEREREWREYSELKRERERMERAEKIDRMSVLFPPSSAVENFTVNVAWLFKCSDKS